MTSRILTLLAPPFALGVLLSSGCAGSIGREAGESTENPPTSTGGNPRPSMPGPGVTMPGTGGTTPGPGGTGTPVVKDATGQTVASLFSCKAGSKPMSGGRVWRLSADQYAATVRSLHPSLAKGTLSNPLIGLSSGERFSNVASKGSLAGAIADQVVRASGETAATLAPALEAAHPCLKAPDAACLKTAFSGLAVKAFRRPVETDEVDRLVKLVQDQIAIVGAPAAINVGVQAVLNSPHFLFRFELGAAQPDATGRRKLTPYEVASALSYTLIDGPPDEALMTAAASGALGTPEQLRTQALRLLRTSAGASPMLRFVREYFGYEETLEVAKNEKTYNFHAPAQLVEETDLFVRDLLAQGKAFLPNLFTANWGYARAKTAPSYNLTGVTATAAQKVTYPAGQRSGILTQPSFLTAYSHAEENDVVKRGKFIATTLLCVGLPETPPNAVPPLPETPNATMRERLSVHANSEPQCRACHDIMDPLGLGLEAYDHVGRHRTMEAGKPVDVSGEIKLTGTPIDGPFNGAAELGQRLGNAAIVEQCFVRFNFRYWFGRNETDLDACSLTSAHEALRSSSGDPVEMVASLMSSESFLYRN